MGQEQLRTGEGSKRQEKEAPQESDRAKVSGFSERMENNDAMKWKGKPSPLSKPT
jgi:hypothetical protein